MVQDRAIYTRVDQSKVVYGLSNGAIFNDFERPLTWYSRSRHSLTLNTAAVTIEGEQVTAPKLSKGTSFNDLE